MGNLLVEQTLKEPITQPDNNLCQIDDGVIAQDIQTQYLSVI